MPHFICTTCGVQHAELSSPPEFCLICQDPRQYLGWGGQQWTTIDQLAAGRCNTIEPEEDGLIGIGTTPRFAIGQRALLIQSSGGNLLWDCISLLDEATIKAVRKLGGIDAIAISHPHYYASMVEWSKAFGNIPIYLHRDDERWVMRPDPTIEYWEGETMPILDGITLIRCGGHFAGATVLHWPSGADGRGALLTGDVIQVCQDRRHVSFMYSYPNLIPLPAESVRRVAASVEPFPYDRIYGYMFDLVIPSNARKAVARSAERYIRATSGEELPA
jgi:glyoxylase-like metal-dependent hydrolase (beta-lactamase superfamily II)